MGLGERYGSGLTEGTLDKANIYEADADDVGFKVWIDDGDYSNDDFTLIFRKPTIVNILTVLIFANTFNGVVYLFNKQIKTIQL